MQRLKLFALLFFLGPVNHGFADLVGSPPTELEQYSLALINRVRSDQNAEAVRLGIIGGVNGSTNSPDDGLGGPVPTITSGFKQPLAFDLDLVEAARNHNGWMDATNTFGHGETGTLGTDCFTGTQSEQRGIHAGFTGVTSFVGENVAARGGTSTDGPNVLGMHNSLFIDRNTAGRGHRTAILSENWQLVGIGISTAVDIFAGFTGPVETQNFGRKTDARFLTGIVFNDMDADSFYTPNNGESLGNYVVEAVAKDGSGTLMTTTWLSGGYTLSLDPTKEYNVAIKTPSGVLVDGTSMMLGIGTANIALNSVNPVAVPEPASFLLVGLFGMAGLASRWIQKLAK